MGFLDHSTNNIIVDAVLTDHGRQKLADATGTNDFVLMFAFGDDEVDYTMTKKYGVIVGKEKIEKNTPVFEASTNESIGIKYYLSTTANPLVAQPTTTATMVPNANLSSTQTQVTINMQTLDTMGLLGNSGVTYDIIFDATFLSTTSNSTGTGTGHSKVITIGTGPQNAASITFNRNTTTAATYLSQIGQTSAITNIAIHADTGAVVHLAINYSTT